MLYNRKGVCIIRSMQYYSVKELATLKKVSRQWINFCIARGTIKAAKCGNQWCIPKRQFPEYADALIHEKTADIKMRTGEEQAGNTSPDEVNGEGSSIL